MFTSIFRKVTKFTKYMITFLGSEDDRKSKPSRPFLPPPSTKEKYPEATCLYVRPSVRT